MPIVQVCDVAHACKHPLVAGAVVELHMGKAFATSRVASTFDAEGARVDEGEVGFDEVGEASVDPVREPTKEPDERRRGFAKDSPASARACAATISWASVIAAHGGGRGGGAEAVAYSPAWPRSFASASTEISAGELAPPLSSRSLPNRPAASVASPCVLGCGRACCGPACCGPAQRPEARTGPGPEVGPEARAAAGGQLWP